jgi:hypothetical protein
MSPAGLELLARARIVGTPATGSPRNTLSTNLGPNLALNTWMRCGPHCGVAADAGSDAAVLAAKNTTKVAASSDGEPVPSSNARGVVLVTG